MSGETKRPAFQFYPKEWVWDIALRGCSVAARGLWADLLCLMHEGTPYGHLSAPEDLILRVIGIPAEEYRALLAELEAKGVPSRTPEGVLYSRRMVRDEERRQTNRTNGKTGGRPKKTDSVSVDNNRLGFSVRGGDAEEKKKNINRTSLEEETRFAEFRDTYPAHRLDNLGLQLFMTSTDQAGILERLRLAVKSEEWTQNGGRYVPKASRWITDGALSPAVVELAPTLTSTMDPETRRRLDERRRQL